MSNRTISKAVSLNSKKVFGRKPYVNRVSNQVTWKFNAVLTSHSYPFIKSHIEDKGFNRPYSRPPKP